jgi:hypothetical protein
MHHGFQFYGAWDIDTVQNQRRATCPAKCGHWLAAEAPNEMPGRAGHLPGPVPERDVTQDERTSEQTRESPGANG